MPEVKPEVQPEVNLLDNKINTVEELNNKDILNVTKTPKYFLNNNEVLNLKTLLPSNKKPNK